MFKLTPNTRYKDFRITKILFEEELKFFLGYENIFALVKFVTIIILSLLKANTLIKKVAPNKL